MHDKITEWFEVIGKVLQDQAILPENVYNINEIGVMLSILGSVKVLVGKDCHELSQSRYESRIRHATTCTNGSSKYKNPKLRKERREVWAGGP